MSILSGIFKGIETLLDIAITSQTDDIQSGDYAKAIFLWYFSKKPSSIWENSDYPHYFLYECGIQNASDYHKKLVQEDYFIKASNEEKLGLKKIPELKEILQRLDLSTAGKKSVLIQRILENAPQKTFTEIFQSEIYSLSDKGRAFLEKHGDYIKLHQHSDLEISSSEYDLEHQVGWSFYDTVWRILNKRIIQDKNNFGRHEYIQMYHLLDEEGKRTDAMQILLRIFCIDLYGLDLHDGGKRLIILAPGIIRDISNHSDVFSEKMIDDLYQWNLSQRTCSKELFSKFVHSIIDETFDLDENAVEKELKKNRRKSRKKLKEGDNNDKQ